METGNYLTWAEISKSALMHNVKEVKKLVLPGVIFCACVKANAWGHGLVQSAQIFLEAGADWLSVNALYEALALRAAGITAPIYIMGYVPLRDMETAVQTESRIVIYNIESVDALQIASQAAGKKTKVHIKIETGLNRQGVLLSELETFTKHVAVQPNLVIEGVATHFADVEDEGVRVPFERQASLLKDAKSTVERICGYNVMAHCSNSASTFIAPHVQFDMVRVGIACYGMWPSSRIQDIFKKEKPAFSLIPAFTWKTMIAQVKKAPKGSYVGYGSSVELSREAIIAVLPVGYYDGYMRAFSNKSRVLIGGKFAPILGRVAMNMIMVDITDIPNVKLEDEVVLLGKQGENEITAEEMSRYADTINYEIPTRVSAGVNTNIPRVVVE